MPIGRKSECQLSFTGLEDILKLMISDYDTFLTRSRPTIDGKFTAAPDIYFQLNSTGC